MIRRASKVDANQSEIVAAFRRLGVRVALLHRVGEGVPDLLTGYRGVDRLVEVKDGSLPPSARQLNPAQVAWHRDWRGCKPFVVTSVDDVITLVIQWSKP